MKKKKNDIPFILLWTKTMSEKYSLFSFLFLIKKKNLHKNTIEKTDRLGEISRSDDFHLFICNWKKKKFIFIFNIENFLIHALAIKVLKSVFGKYNRTQR